MLIYPIWDNNNIIMDFIINNKIINNNNIKLNNYNNCIFNNNKIYKSQFNQMDPSILWIYIQNDIYLFDNLEIIIINELIKYFQPI